MKIKIDNKEIIPLDEFSLNWRFDKVHNPIISKIEKSKIQPLSEVESKRINKIIDFFENETNRIRYFSESGRISATQDSTNNIKRFINVVDNELKLFEEDLIITWDRKITLKTTKEIFLKFWTDFLYPSSDNVTIISEKTNWMMFYNHYEVANIWIRNNTEELSK